MKILIGLLLISLLSGCGFVGPSALPEPTEKTVTKSDIVGTWKYDADFRKTIITIELKPDGTFVQIINHTGIIDPQIHKGTWNLEGTTPKLMVLKPVFGDATKPWVPEYANWWIVDSHQVGVEFAICGAADDRDPDSCFEMKKIR